MKLTKVRWVNLPPTAFVTSARPMGRPQTLAVSPFFNLPEPSIAHRSTIDPLRWLRALGSEVEILLPWDLRQKMAVEIQKTRNLYQ